MKKILVSLMALTILSSTAVYASDTPISDWINSKTSKITQKKNLQVKRRQKEGKNNRKRLQNKKRNS